MDPIEADPPLYHTFPSCPWTRQIINFYRYVVVKGWEDIWFIASIIFFSWIFWDWFHNSLVIITLKNNISIVVAYFFQTDSYLFIGFYFILFASIISFKITHICWLFLYLIYCLNNFSVSWIFWVWFHNFLSRFLWRTIWVWWFRWLFNKYFFVEVNFCYFSWKIIVIDYFSFPIYCLNHFYVSWIFWVWFHYFWSRLIWIIISPWWFW